MASPRLDAETVDLEGVDLLVAVVTFHSADLVPGLVSSLRSGLADIPSWRLVVADNDSADDTLTQLGEHAPDARVVRMGGNAGYAAGVNAAVRAGGPHTHVLVLNPDVRLTPGAVSALLRGMAAAGAGVAVPAVQDAGGRPSWSLRREPALRRAWVQALVGTERAGRWHWGSEVVTDPSAYERAGVVDWAVGAVLLVSRECERAVGDWDEGFFLYSEESDYLLRARDAGFRTWYVPSAVVAHFEGESRQSPPLWALLQLNRVRAFRKRRGWLAAALFWLATLVGELLRTAQGSEVSRAAVAALLTPPWLRRGPLARTARLGRTPAGVP